MDILPFYLEQYKMLREEIMFTIGQLYSTETYSVIVVIAVYLWLLANPSRIAIRAIWFIPPCLIVIAAVHCIFLQLRLAMMGEYLRGIEEIVLGPDTKIQGWEHYKLSHGQWVEGTDVVLASLAWVFALIVSIAIACRRPKVRLS